MAANNPTSDLNHLPVASPSFVFRTKAAASGMELTSSRFSSQPRSNQSSQGSPNMSTLVMRTPSFRSSPGRIWEDRSSMTTVPSKPLSPPAHPELIELPSIRLAVPEIQLRNIRLDSDFRAEQTHFSPATVPRSMTSPGYVPAESLHKRRKLSNEDDQNPDSRDPSFPRLFRSPSRPQCSQSAALSPKVSARRASIVSTAESWSRSSPYSTERGLSAIQSPRNFDSARSDWRGTLPTLPSLPAMTFDTSLPQNERGHSNWSDYAFGSARSGAYQPSPASTFESSTPAFNQPAFPYGYNQPQGQSIPGHPFSQDRTPFPSNSHHSAYAAGGYPYGLDMSEMGSDNKQRKRRGNLPKETTDKLRAWFHAHLQHPYPTEDEKQELMRQTGLQLNQISNWFINARRRQLPAMINNARVESGATTRGADGGLKRDYSVKAGSVSLVDSDGEGSIYEEEYASLGGRSMLVKRGSI